MNKNKGLSCQWILFPILFSSASVLAGGLGGVGLAPDAGGQATALSAEGDGFLDDAEQVNGARMNYVGGNTRIGVGIDTEFKGRIDGSHIFMENEDSVTSGQGWLGVNPRADDNEETVTGVGAKINHHWVTRDADGNPLHVNKVFGAYDQNEAEDKKISAGYGQEKENFFWSGHVSKGLSDMRYTGSDDKHHGAHIYEKAYDFGVGGRVGTFMSEQLLRVQGGLDYEWGTEYAEDYEDMPSQLTVSGGVEKFFRDSPHSIGANIEVSKQSGGYEYGDDETDVSGNVSYRYDFGGAGLFAAEEQYRRVRVEIPGKTERVKVKQKRAPVKKKRAPKVERKLVKHTMELEADTFFERGKHYLTPQAQQRMQAMMARIRDTGHHGNIRITGNTCDLGSDAMNQALSERRAAQVRSFMVANGFNANELVARGLGETQPKYPNTEATRHRNRRVDIEYVAYQNKYENKVVEQGYDVVDQGYDVVEKVRVVSEPRVVWRRELIPSPPTWVSQAMRNNIQYKQTIDTYRTLGEDFRGGGQPDNNAPDAVDDQELTKVNTAVNIDVIANDSDADGDTLTIIDFTTATGNGGTVTQGSDGVLVYTPATDFTGTDTFTYTVSDGHGGQATATVTVIIEDNGSANTAPVAQNDSGSTKAGESLTIPVLGNDADADGDALTISAVDATSQHGGTVTISGNGVIYTPADGFTGTDTFNYSISDGQGGTATATVTVDVSFNPPVNDLDAADDKASTKVDTAVTIDVLGNDSDPDGDVVLLDSYDSGSRNGGTITESADGLVYTPAAGFTGTDTFSYTAKDDNGESDSAVVTVTVAGDPDPDPDMEPVADQYTLTPADLNGLGETALNVKSNDKVGDSTIIRIITPPAKGSIENASGGDITDDHVVYKPQDGASGTDTFTYALVDGEGNVSEPVTVTITLPSVPDSDLQAIDDGTGGEQVGDVYSFYPNDTMTRTLNVLGNDIGEGLTVVGIVTEPRFGHAEPSADGSSINYTLRHGKCEDHYFVYRVRDADGNEDEATVYINIIDGTTCINC